MKKYAYKGIIRGEKQKMGELRAKGTPLPLSLSV
jgi:hypothetical protein